MSWGKVYRRAQERAQCENYKPLRLTPISEHLSMSGRKLTRGIFNEALRLLKERQEVTVPLSRAWPPPPTPIEYKPGPSFSWADPYSGQQIAFSTRIDPTISGVNGRSAIIELDIFLSDEVTKLPFAQQLSIAAHEYAHFKFQIGTNWWGDDDWPEYLCDAYAAYVAGKSATAEILRICGEPKRAEAVLHLP